MRDVIIALLADAGITGALVGLIVWSTQRKLLKKEKEREQREADREQFELLLIEGIDATNVLAEATAKAVQRIPDAHCNGDMHKALEYAEGVKHKRREFLAKQGIHSMN